MKITVLKPFHVDQGTDSSGRFLGRVILPTSCAAEEEPFRILVKHPYGEFPLSLERFSELVKDGSMAIEHQHNDGI